MAITTNNKELALKAGNTLRSVYDPEIGLNVIDLGLIYRLEFDSEKQHIFVEMTLTTRFCPMGESIITAVQQCVELTFPGHAVYVQLNFETPWSPDLISEEGKMQLEQ